MCYIFNSKESDMPLLTSHSNSNVLQLCMTQLLRFNTQQTRAKSIVMLHFLYVGCTEKKECDVVAIYESLLHFCVYFAALVFEYYPKCIVQPKVHTLAVVGFFLSSNPISSFIILVQRS